MTSRKDHSFVAAGVSLPAGVAGSTGVSDTVGLDGMGFVVDTFFAFPTLGPLCTEDNIVAGTSAGGYNGFSSVYVLALVILIPPTLAIIVAVLFSIIIRLFSSVSTAQPLELVFAVLVAVLAFELVAGLDVVVFAVVLVFAD